MGNEKVIPFYLTSNFTGRARIAQVMCNICGADQNRRLTQQ